MAVTDYVGRTPQGVDDRARIDRVTTHRVWDVDPESTGDCANCGTALRLSERHLLVRLAARASVDRRYL